MVQVGSPHQPKDPRRPYITSHPYIIIVKPQEGRLYFLGFYIFKTLYKKILIVSYVPKKY